MLWSNKVSSHFDARAKIEYLGKASAIRQNDLESEERERPRKDTVPEEHSSGVSCEGGPF